MCLAFPPFLPPTSPLSILFVLTSTSLQKWYIGDSQEQLVYDASLEETIKDAVQNAWVGSHRLLCSMYTEA